MKITTRAAILIFSAMPLASASTSVGREIRPVLVESEPVKLLPVVTTIPAPVVAPIVAKNPVLIVTPIAAPVAVPVANPVPVVTAPAITPSIIIYPTTPIIYPTTPISL